MIPAALHPDRIATALAAVANPAAHGGHAALLAAAWSDLKAARGQTVDFDRLQPAYLIDRQQPLDPVEAHLPSPAAIEALTFERIRRRVQARMAALRGHAPEGGAA